MTSQATTADVVTRIIAEHVGRPVQEIRPDARLQADLGVDSLMMIEINVSLEAHYRRTFYDFVDEPTFVTVADVIDFVKQKLQERDR